VKEVGRGFMKVGGLGSKTMSRDCYCQPKLLIHVVPFEMFKSSIILELIGLIDFCSGCKTLHHCHLRRSVFESHLDLRLG
jgi:hypothetical protein